MSELYKLVKEQGFKAVAIVGATKNVGKTVTFNHLAGGGVCFRPVMTAKDLTG